MPVRIVRRKPSPDQLGLDACVHPVLARVLGARDVSVPQELDYSLRELLSFDDLSGIEDALSVLRGALAAQKRIVIVGDFDADGATASVVAVLGLRMLGFAHVTYLVPNRFEYGYGLTPEIVAVAARSQPDLLITVDNGISSVEGVDAARACGIEVIITDHHLPGEVMPRASAIVNPNLPEDGFASKNLAGVGVIFYVLAALRATLRGRDWFAQNGVAEPNLATLLDLVALGTVADVVPLDRNNRILVEQGLRRIRSGRCRSGIKALLKVCKRTAARAVASDLAFGVAPRLNAAGRLTDMSLGIECLLAEDEGTAMDMALRLDELNRERRSIEANMQCDALSYLEKLSFDTKNLPVGVCLFDEQWHQGVIGILAARIKDRFHRPVIAFARSTENELKGSARSISQLHIRDALDAIATAYPGLITRFGGHAMAAGLSIATARLSEFSQAFDAHVSSVLSATDLEGVVYTDGALSATDIGVPLAEALRSAGPWGQSFPEPLFDGEFDVVGWRMVGEKHLKLRLAQEGGKAPVEAMAFNVDAGLRPDAMRRVRVAYRLDVNLYGGYASPQLVVEHIESLSD